MLPRSRPAAAARPCALISRPAKREPCTCARRAPGFQYAKVMRVMLKVKVKLGFIFIFILFLASNARNGESK